MIEGSRPRGHDSVTQDGDATDNGVAQNSEATPHADATAGVHEASLVPVVTVLQTDGSRFVDAVFTHLFARRPSFIRRLPADLSQIKPSFRRALVHVYAKQATGNGLDRRTRRFLRHLAEDHRSFGVEAPDYVAMGDAIIDAGREIIAPQVTSEEFELFAMATGQIIGLLEEGAAEYSEVPVRWGATVLDVDHRSDAITVVRLAADSPIPYRAGQLVPVLAPQSSGKRKWLAPAIPHSDDGLIEFHLEVPRLEGAGQQALTGSSALVFDLARMTRPGDVWEIGAARGSMTVDLLDGSRPVLMVAHGAHLAAIRAIILDLASKPSPPQTHLFFGAEYPSDLYELRTLWSFDTAMDWLTVHPSTMHAEEDQFARMSAYAVAPRDFTVREGISLADDVMARGPWLGHETLLAGPKTIVGDIKRKLMASGMNPALITMTS
ncbi:hypothetical protein [Corynebacterium sp.]|uniref:hypothetical protein n=1 Tax=Corynebacterium sp. TaxID=1720 RepID=UPI0026DB50DF|nr:hypothetical protein [Corynebacterium sp.]MDO4914841.1 hypothetical protein [Corynebacterium sp.]